MRFANVARRVHRLHQVSTVPSIVQADTDSLHDHYKDCRGRGPARDGTGGEEGSSGRRNGAVPVCADFGRSFGVQGHGDADGAATEQCPRKGGDASRVEVVDDG